ncbi:MAG: hypothetical protein KDD25_06175, partial [Bdellovibrionales bacterium]|nr:hypothetical protein [Bdellovibrionales bacterium]
MIRLFDFMLISILMASCVSAHPIARRNSLIWGEHGEKWNKSRLPDFTNAGAFAGKMEIPVYNKTIELKDFGAVGDGIADDSLAFIHAIKKCGEKSTLQIPIGRYKLSHPLIVSRSQCVIRGAGVQETTLRFERGLEEIAPRFDGEQTDWSWSGAMVLFDNVRESGIENLTIEFPDHEWGGHNFHERGYNAIGYQNGSRDSWARKLTIRGADLGIWIEQSANHITTENWKIEFGPNREKQKLSCHHAVNVYGGFNLFQSFEIDGTCQHDLSVESGYSHHNVYSKGRGRNLSFDHNSQDYNQKFNLFTDIDIGEGTRMYLSGGQLEPRGVSFNETWWNIRSRVPVPWVTSKGVSKSNIIVGVNAGSPSVFDDE